MGRMTTRILLPALGFLCGAAFLLHGAHTAFVRLVATPHSQDVVLPRRLRADIHGALPEARSVAGSASVAAVLIGAVVGASARAAGVRSRVACKAAGAKGKGVRVVQGREIPWNVFGPRAPYTAKVVESRTLTEPSGEANWETKHIVIDHGGSMPYLEGQSIGIIAPGPDKQGSGPAKGRLYSIASSASGDDETHRTVSLCVKRLVEVDGPFANRGVGEDLPDSAGTHFPESSVYRGVSSDYLCDLRPGDDVLITGPTGAEMLLPEDPDADLIMLATGTGIAPMRAYLRALFHDAAAGTADGTRRFRGRVWLFVGVPYAKSLLYEEELAEYKREFPGQFRYDFALSREETNSAGERMYIQTKMAEHGDELWRLIEKPTTHLFLCGLKGMEAGVEECFVPLAEKNGTSWKELVAQMKKAKRFHKEVY